MSNQNSRITRNKSEIDKDKTKRKASDQFDPNKTAKVSKMSDEISLVLAAMLQKIHDTTCQTNSEVLNIKKEFSDVKNEIRSVQTKVDDLDKQMEERIEAKVNQMIQNKNVGCQDNNEAYWSSRRSLLVYPIYSDKTEQLSNEIRLFLTKTLCFSEIEVTAMDISAVELIMKRRRHQIDGWRMVKMMRVSFRSKEDRDLVMSKIPRLATDRKYKMEMDIPDYLTPLYRSLDRKAYEIRQNENRKTSIPYDDSKMSLILLARVPGLAWENVEIQ